MTKSRNHKIFFGNFQIFALIFTAIFLLHGPLLRLPYFWDEAGYYIPAAYDLYTNGNLIPQSVPSNGHPPLPALYLAGWWKFSAFKPSVTRIAMLLVAALALTAVFRLGRFLVNAPVAIATTVTTAIFPVWFAQSSLAHADLMAAAFSLWGMFFYFRSLPEAATRIGNEGPILVSRQEAAEERRQSRRHLILASAGFAVASLSKETAIIIPASLAAYDVVVLLLQKTGLRRQQWIRPPILWASSAPLVLWYFFHHHRTGFYFGNPQFFAYNVSATLIPLRVLLALGLRIWQLLGYMNMWLLTLATVWAMRYAALKEKNGVERPRIALAVQFRIAAVVLANAVLFSFVGGAALARYLLPVYPLVILIGISTLRRRLPGWVGAVAVVIASFIVALFANPFGYSAPEDNLGYRNYVVIHKEAADYLQRHFVHARVLTAWPASDELTKPFLGYVRQPMNVVRVEDFSFQQWQIGQMAAGQYDVALLFSTKPEPAASLLDRWPWWEHMSSRFFGFHRDLSPRVGAEILGGRITWEESRGRQWAAVVSIEQVENAALL